MSIRLMEERATRFMRHEPRSIRFLISVTLVSATLVSGCASVPSVERNPSSEKQPGLQARSAPTHEQINATASYHFAMAQAYSAEGNPDRAIEEYKLTLMYDPDSAVAHARLATEYIKKGMLSQAMETCKEAISRDPKYIDARMILAGLYSTSREFGEAIVQLDHVLSQDPGHEEAAVYKAQAFLDQDKVEDASKTMKGFVARNADSALGWYYLGRTYHKGGRVKEAEAAYLRAVDVRPNFTQALLSLGFLYEESKLNDKALKTYRELYDFNQDSTAASRISTIYLKNEQYQEAIPYLEAVETSDPEDMNARVKLGLVYMELKQYPKAIRTFEELLKVSPDSDRINFYLGSLYEELEMKPEAITTLKRVPASSKLFTDAVLHVAQLLKEDRRFPEARTYLKESIIRSPRTSGFYLFLASMEEDLGNVKDAVSTMERAHHVFPEDERTLYYLGALYERAGQTDKGIEKMQALLEVNPDNPDALNYLGYTWTIRDERMDEAERYLRKAMKLRPNNAYILDSWGWHLFVRGKLSQSIVTLEKAASLKSDEPTILEHLADAYARANLQEKALATYEKAAKYTEDQKARDQIAAKVESLKTLLVQSGRKKASSTRSPASETQ